MEVAINLLLLGETGVGKSTFINSFANYMVFPDLEKAKSAEHLMCPIFSTFTVTDAYFEMQRVVIGNPSNNENYNTPGESSTQGCKCYEFLIPFADRMVRLRLIDTPGVGDTRGSSQDNKNFDDILKHLTLYTHLNAICILLKPNNSRLNHTFRYCVKELLKHLHKSAKDNILFFFTNSRSTFYKPGDTLPILKKLLEDLSATADISIPINRNNMFCFDNEAFRFLATLRMGIAFDDTDAKAFETSWARAYAENLRLFERILDLPRHNLTATLSLNQARKFLVQLANPMAAVIKSNNINMKNMKDDIAELQRLELSMSDLEKRVKITKLSPVVVQLDYPRTVCSMHKQQDGQTTVYTQICHTHCYIAGVPTTLINRSELQRCDAMKRGKCKHSQCEHGWELHMHITYDIKFEDAIVDDEGVLKEISLKQDQQLMQQAIIDRRAKEIAELAQEHKLMLDTLAKFATFLKENAIVKYNDDLKAYLEMQLKEENEKLQGGADNRDIISQLENDLNCYNAEVEAFTSHVALGKEACTLETFPDLVRALYAMKHNGKVVQGLALGVQEASEMHSAGNLNDITETFSAPASISSGLFSEFNSRARKVAQHLIETYPDDSGIQLL